MSAHPFLAGLLQSPDYLLQNLDFINRRGLVIRTSRNIYRNSAFLDDRMFEPSTQGAWFPLDTLLEITAALPDTGSHYIFHIGHCGSTLLSRLLAEIPGCFSLREPLAFLALAMARRELGTPAARLDEQQWQELFQRVLRLLARGYNEGETALIKGTSTAANLLEPVLSAQPDAKAILLYMDLKPWLATMLRANDTRESLRAAAGIWITDFQRLTQDDSIRLSGLDDVQQAVISWATMMLTFTRASTRYPSRIHWLNFDRFLIEPAKQCGLLAQVLGLAVTVEMIDSLVNDPIMDHYAKDPNQPFNATVRNRELTEARQYLATEIQAGEAWFEQLAARIPMLASLGPGALYS